MSTKIRVSYESADELLEVLKRLEPMVKSYKLPRKQEGHYKKAYIVLKSRENKPAM